MGQNAGTFLLASSIKFYLYLLDVPPSTDEYLYLRI